MVSLSHRIVDSPAVCVFAPSLFLTVTIEPGVPGGGEEIHIHPGGQGFWIARLLAQLGCSPVLCAPLGGEAGSALELVTRDWGVRLRAVAIESSTPCLVFDRRSGVRVPVARDRPVVLKRHEADDLYGLVLDVALSSDACVVTGVPPGDQVPVELYHRLAADLEHLDVPVTADLHGVELDAFLDGGHLSLLKVSDEDLLADGRVPDLEEATLRAAMDALARRGIDWVVVSRAERGALMAADGVIIRAKPPVLEVVDHTGAGDSMSAALIAGLLSGADPVEAIRLGCAAGAANVTRHGLGTASPSLVRHLADEVEVERLEPVS